MSSIYNKINVEVICALFTVLLGFAKGKGVMWCRGPGSETLGSVSQTLGSGSESLGSGGSTNGSKRPSLEKPKVKLFVRSCFVERNGRHTAQVQLELVSITLLR